MTTHICNNPNTGGPIPCQRKVTDPGVSCGVTHHGGAAAPSVTGPSAAAAPALVAIAAPAAPRWWCHCYLRDEEGECDCEPGEAPWLTDPAETARLALFAGLAEVRSAAHSSPDNRTKMWAARDFFADSGITGYTFAADTYCPDCVLSALPEHYTDGMAGDTLSATGPVNVEGALWDIAANGGVNREDEYSFDSDEFPKVILPGMAEETTTCGQCGARIG